MMMAGPPDGIEINSSWPNRFAALHGRKPRILHICNIANYAWVNAALMQRAGAENVVLDPDYYHINSAPEWYEADVSRSHGDDFYPRWHAAGLTNFTRPEFYINGPTPFVYRELAARNHGQRIRRGIYRALSGFYRWGLGSADQRPSWFRRLMESESAASRGLKSVARALALRSMPAAPAIAEPLVAGEGALRNDMAGRNALPSRVPRTVLESALAPFDIIVGYALGARVPAAMGFPRYVSLELGTIRGLPFEDSDLGRLTAWLYKASPEVFITNTDCMESADRLGIDPSRRTAIPHPFNLDAALCYKPSVSPLAGTIPYFFAPARHHWQSGNASWLKGNDVLIRGAAKAAAMGAKFRLVFVEWGAEIEKSRKLLDECGLSDRVIWIKPMHRKLLWPIICGAVAVLDQFAAKAFGGAGLETMALGKRLVSRCDEDNLRPFFDTPTPIFAAQTDDEIAQAMIAILDDPDDHAGKGLAGQEWMKREHSVARQLGMQFTAFERLITLHGPAIDAATEVGP